MVTGEGRAWARPHINSLRRAVVGVVGALALLAAAAGPAAAVSQDGTSNTAAGPAAAVSQDGTSNTIQYAVTSAVLDQAHHRVIVTAPAASGLTAGRHLATVEIVTPTLRYTFENVMVESIASTSTSLSLNFTSVNVNYAAGHAPCTSGVDACLMENDGIWLPGG